MDWLMEVRTNLGMESLEYDRERTADAFPSKMIFVADRHGSEESLEITTCCLHMIFKKHAAPAIIPKKL